MKPIAILTRKFILLPTLAAGLAFFTPNQMLAQTNASATAFQQIDAESPDHYIQKGFSIIPSKDGAYISCPLQKLVGRATTQGLSIASVDRSSHSAPCRVITQSVGRGHKTAIPLDSMGEIKVLSSTVRFHRVGADEEYSVSRDGIRQDTILANRPAGQGALRVNYLVEGARVEDCLDGTRLFLNAANRTLNYNHLKVVDAHGQQLNASFEVVSPSQLVVVVDDASAVYPVCIDPTFSDADWLGLGGLNSAIIGEVQALACDSSGNLYVASSYKNYNSVISEWNGYTWSVIGIPDSLVNTLVCDNSGNLYAGGEFSSVNGVSASSIAVWNGGEWYPLGSGIYGTVSALICDKAGDIYAGGSFSAAGSVNATNIAKWHGTDWSTLGSGLGFYSDYRRSVVEALACDSSGDIYGAGIFDGAGSVAANCIAKWDGNKWSALGMGLTNGFGYALACDTHGNLFVGGDFGTEDISSIAKWDGSTWSALGSGVNGPINALTSDSSGNIYAAGVFTTAGEVNANCIAKWNGNTWSALGSGMSGGDIVGYTDRGANYFGCNVNDLALDAFGILYAGGNFYTAGTNVADYIAEALLTGVSTRPPPGYLQVTINPSAAVIAGAQWQVDGGSFQNSGIIVSNLSVGMHTVSLGTVSGWTPGPDVRVSIMANSTTTAYGSYVQFTYTITNGTVTVTGYSGSGGPLVIPDTLGGLPVTAIDQNAFQATELTSVTIGNNVTSIGPVAFNGCLLLTNVTIGTGVTNIETGSFGDCELLSNVNLGNSVINIGDSAFFGCYLSSLIIPSSVAVIGKYALAGQYAWAGVNNSYFNIYFQGNAPSADSTTFDFNPETVTNYFLPGTTGWTSTFAGRPTRLWMLPRPMILSSSVGFGKRTNPFGFTISWATNVSVVIESITNLLNPKWQPLQTNVLVNGTNYFSDPKWNSYPNRFYRVSSP